MCLFHCKESGSSDRGSGPNLRFFAFRVRIPGLRPGVINDGVGSTKF